MKVLHVINKRWEDGPGLRNLWPAPDEKDVFHSGYWDIPLAEAEALVGGMLYLHETKAKPSGFGGRVLAVEQREMNEFAKPMRAVFKVQSLREGRGQRWRGADHAMASYGSIIEVDG